VIARRAKPAKNASSAFLATLLQSRFSMSFAITSTEGDKMLTFEETQTVLDELIDELPPEIFNGLNCGVALLPDTMYGTNGLLILGQYHVEPQGLGRYVTINYGSIVYAHGHLSREDFREKVKYVLHHELTHHLESLAGDKSLEVQDAIDIRKMLRLY